MKRVTLILIVCLFSANIFADTKSMLDSAKNYYTQGDFYEAQLIYQNIVDDGYSSYELYYNLANCFFRGDQFAQAIYYYEKALQLNPNDENAQANLRIANARIPDKINELQPIFYVQWYNSVVSSLSSNSWAIIFVVLLIISIGSTILFLLSPNRNIKKIGFLLGVVFLITSFFSLYFSIKQRQSTKYSTYAIVFEDLLVKSSPSVDGNNLFEIHKGLKVSIKDSLNNWSEIRLPDGKTGWAMSSGLKNL